jgi:hypothetical protein
MKTLVEAMSKFGFIMDQHGRKSEQLTTFSESLSLLNFKEFNQRFVHCYHIADK